MAHTGEVRALWIIVVVAACGGPDAPISLLDSGAKPVSYRLSVGWMDPAGKDPLAPRPTVYIDGVQTEEVLFEFASTTEGLAQQHSIELRHGDGVVFSQQSTSSSRVCLAQVPDAITGYEGWCAYSNGELRFSQDSAQGTRVCIGDGFCRPVCWPPTSGCSETMRCTSIYTSITPAATHLGCAPIGTQALDQPCKLVTDASGTHDNCGANGLCVAGTCRRICQVDGGLPTGCTACSYLAEHAYELGICN